VIGRERINPGLRFHIRIVAVRLAMWLKLPFSPVACMCEVVHIAPNMRMLSFWNFILDRPYLCLIVEVAAFFSNIE